MALFFIIYDGLLKHTGISCNTLATLPLMVWAVTSSLWICEKLDGIDSKKKEK